jgi:hypothetical protein
MQYSIHKRRKLKTGKRQKAVLTAPVVERAVTRARRSRQELAPAITRPEPDHVIAPEPEPPVIVAEAESPEPAFADRRELIRIIHQTPVGLQRTFTPLPPPRPDQVAAGSVVAKRPTLDDE